MKAKRLLTHPIITPDLDEKIGTNINGPSLIRVPDWLPDPLGAYYLYFAHHQGKYIRLAYADQLTGPWQVYTPGTLHLEETPCHSHIASPDVHIDHENQRLVMYYHGPVLLPEAEQSLFTPYYELTGGQLSLVATSANGIDFESGHEFFGPSYFRVFVWCGYTYALGMPGIFFRSKDGLTGFEQGPTLFNANMRHSALLLADDLLHVFYTQAGDCPEQILHATIHLTPDWHIWQASEPVPLLRPEMAYEGANLPLVSSARGAIHEPANQLRDPCIFEEAGRIYLLYSVAGESGIAIAELCRE